MRTGEHPDPDEEAEDLDARLMQRVARGDQEAFAHLLQRHQRQVFSLIYRSVGSVADAEDLAQEVFLRVYRAAGRYHPTARFTTWLYRVTTNVVINWLRRRRREPVELSRLTGEDREGQELPTVVDPTAETGLEVLDHRELRQRVRRAIESLPPNQRLAVLLFRFEGLSYRELAQVLDCSVMAVKSLLARARENLRLRLAPYLGYEAPFPSKQSPSREV